MERRKSTSRSPSLSRRPSLKEKKGVTLIAKKKKSHGPGGKKERWLLTRKTWRYMTDAVGNLLPEYRTSSNAAAGGGTGTGSGSGTSASTSRRGSGVGGVRSTVSPPGQLQPHQLQQWTIQQQQWVQQHTSSSSMTFSTGTMPSTSASGSASGGQSGQPGQGQQPPWQGGQQQPKSKPTSPTSSTFPPWGSFPSHRPGVTPTGPGPGGCLQRSGQFGFAFGPNSPNKYINPAVDPEDIPQVEQHFQDVCTKEKKFLLWTRTKPKALSGPALRDLKLKEAEEAAAAAAATAAAALAAARAAGSSSGKKLLCPDYFSPDEFGDEEEDDYDEYGAEDEDQITVRERRKSSTASSTISSILGGPGGSTFFRPLSSGGGGGGGGHSHSDTSYSMVGGPGEGQRVVRHTGIQTDPFPEELLIRLRLQAVHDERQKQIQAMQIQLQRQHQHQQQQQQQQRQGQGQGQGQGHWGQGQIGHHGEDYGDGHGGSGQGMGPWYGGGPSGIGGGSGSGGSGSGPSVGNMNYPGSGGHQGHGTLGGVSGTSAPGYGGNLRTVCLSNVGPGGGAKETVIPISTGGSGGTGTSGDPGGQSQGQSHALRSQSTSGRESEEKVLEKSGGSGSGGGSGAVDSTDKKSEESGYSSSISDTVMKYLRIMRKNSKADNKETIDKFKTVNYDRSLRYIKSKNVTVEEALEHEKNKALGLSGGGVKGGEESGASGDPAMPQAIGQGQSQGQVQGQGQSSTTPTTTKQGPTSGKGEKVGKGVGVKGVKKKVDKSGTPLSPTSSSSSPPPPPGQQSPPPPPPPPTLVGGYPVELSPSPPPTTSTSSPSSQPCSPPPELSGQTGGESADPTGTTPTKKKTGVKKGTKVKVAVGKEKSGSGKAAGTTALDSKDISTSGQSASVSGSTVIGGSGVPSPGAQPGIMTPTTTPLKQGIGIGGQIETNQLSNVTSSEMTSSTCASFSNQGSSGGLVPAQGQIQGQGQMSRLVTSPPKEVGIQAGESLIKYLRKLSDFSSVASASESPAELVSLSPRLSIATSEGAAEWYLHQTGGSSSYHAQHSTTSSGIPTTTRSSFDAFDLYSVGGGDSSASTSEWEDAWAQQLLLYQQLFQQQQMGGQIGGQIGGGQIEGSSLLSPPPQATLGKGGLSPIPASATGSSGSSGSGSSGSGGTGRGSGSGYSPRSQHHALNVKISGSPLPSSGSTPSTPGGGSGSSIISSHGGHGGGGGLMKSFFSSSPFSSSFGFRSSSTKKPSSTSSLVLHPPGGGISTSASTSGLGLGLGRGGGLLGLPPTTSSSPNLLSLVHSTSGSGSHSHHGGHSSGHSHSHAGHSHSFFRSSDRDLGGGGGSSSFGLGLASLGSGWGGGMLSRVGSRSGGSGGHHGSSGSGSGVGFGSKVTQKGQMSLPLGSESTNPSSSNPVMQKSKSSSSVGGGGGGGGGGIERGGTTPHSAGTATATTAAGATKGLMSKSSRIFKSRSKSTTRVNTSSSGSAPCSWAPQGKCRWRSPSGKTITLEATTVLTLSEVERATLAEVALEKVKSLGLGVEIKLPKEKTGAPPKKRRPYLLKKKALSTGFFEGGKREDGQKESGGPGSGAVFGISLSQCVVNDRLRQGQGQNLSPGQGQSQNQACMTSATTTTPSSTTGYRKRSQNGSRNSVVDVQTTTTQSQQRHDDKGSTESLFWGKRGSVAAVESIPAVGPSSMDLLQPPTPAVPAIVKACVEHLESYGLHTTGIFRVSTSLKRIRQLREEIDGGKEIQFGEEHSPHDVAALLKEFLRDLPDPLLSRELYQPFLKTQKIRNRKQQLEAVQHLVQLLPAANRDTLASLLAFFAKVVANAGETRSSGGELLPGNKMEGYSLATLIAPNILPCMEGGGSAAGSGDHTLTKERRESIDVVNYMISNYTQLFEVSPELLHDVYLHLMDTQPEAVEGILKIKSGFVDDPNDEMETSSVFEGSECGEVPEGEETALGPAVTQRVFRRREDILHEGAARGGPISGYQTESTSATRFRSSGSDRVRGKRDSSRERGTMSTSTASDADKGGQSGAESDSSSTKSTSRWFRRTRPDKPRTSSDSGSEKVKSFGGSGHGHHGGSSGHQVKGGLESKRANSLDSVASGSGSCGGVGGQVPTASSREKSNSDQSLKVPENLNRRQSSPVLESGGVMGVITASLKIPVPVPLNIDDSDIPFIEEDANAQTHHYSPRQMHQQQIQPPMSTSTSTSTSSSTYPSAPARSRGRSASTDSCSVVKSPPSSHTTTPISSPGRGPSSEVSSPLGFSPPGSPPYDPNTFPYEEMTARILLGGSGGGGGGGCGSDAVTASTSTSTTVTTTLDKAPAKVVTSLYLQPAANAPTGQGSSQTQQQTSTASVYIPGLPSDQKLLGREMRVSTTSGNSSIGGLIKSKTADFEKLAKSPSTPAVTAASPSGISTYSIAPKMRLRSQENIVLKQQFLLRQQQLQQQHPHYAHPSQEEGRRGKEPAPATTTTTSTSIPGAGHQEGGQSPSSSPKLRSSSSSTSISGSGPRPVTRRRQPLSVSASSSAIILSSGTSGHRPSGLEQSSPSSTPTSGPTPSPTPTLGSGGGSPSRWKRSEIIASRHEEETPHHSHSPHQSHHHPSTQNPSPGRSRGPPETFL